MLFFKGELPGPVWDDASGAEGAVGVVPEDLLGEQGALELGSDIVGAVVRGGAEEGEAVGLAGARGTECLEVAPREAREADFASDFAACGSILL